MVEFGSVAVVVLVLYHLQTLSYLGMGCPPVAYGGVSYLHVV